MSVISLVFYIEFILGKHFVLIVLFQRRVKVFVSFLCLSQSLVIFHRTVFGIHALYSFRSVYFWLFWKQENFGYYLFVVLFILNLLRCLFRGKPFWFKLFTRPVCWLGCLFWVLSIEKLGRLIRDKFLRTFGK